MTTELVFPALTLFNILTFPLAILPMVITAIVEASVAVNRLTSFFTADELQTDAVIYQDAASEPGEETVRIRDATLTWNKEEGRNALEGISFSACKGELSCIVGRVGTGKSSMLQAMLGDLWKINGEIVVHGTTAYVAQQSWVMNATIQENIVFGHRWDPSFYELTIKACALIDDFRTLPDGDQTEVGERGISLSGGQKARLTLARAVYARADVYLLDDCLSAVDQHVGRHIINNVLGHKGILASKTRILATNSIPVLREADNIVLLRDGKIVERGNYDQMVAMRGEMASIIKTSNNDESDDEAMTPSSDASSTMVATGLNPSEEDRYEETDDVGNLEPLRPGLVDGMRNRKSSAVSLRRASTASFKGPRRKIMDEEDQVTGPKGKQNKEFSEQGKVKWKVYVEYAKASNLIAVSIYLGTMVASQTAQVGK